MAAAYSDDGRSWSGLVEGGDGSDNISGVRERG